MNKKKKMRESGTLPVYLSAAGMFNSITGWDLWDSRIRGATAMVINMAVADKKDYGHFPVGRTVLECYISKGVPAISLTYCLNYMN